MASAAISASTSGDNTIVAAVAGRRIRVIGLAVSCSAAVNVRLKSGANVNLTGLLYGAAAGALLALSPADSPDGWAVTNPGEPLVLNLSSAVAVGGVVAYVVEL